MTLFFSAELANEIFLPLRERLFFDFAPVIFAKVVAEVAFV